MLPDRLLAPPAASLRPPVTAVPVPGGAAELRAVVSDVGVGGVWVAVPVVRERPDDPLTRPAGEQVECGQGRWPGHPPRRVHGDWVLYRVRREATYRRPHGRGRGVL